jgi:hypothetical protein
MNLLGKGFDVTLDFTEKDNELLTEFDMSLDAMRQSHKLVIEFDGAGTSSRLRQFIGRRVEMVSDGHVFRRAYGTHQKS